MLVIDDLREMKSRDRLDNSVAIVNSNSLVDRDELVVLSKRVDKFDENHHLDTHCLIFEFNIIFDTIVIDETTTNDDKKNEIAIESIDFELK